MIQKRTTQRLIKAFKWFVSLSSQDLSLFVDFHTQRLYARYTRTRQCATEIIESPLFEPLLLEDFTICTFYYPNAEVARAAPPPADSFHNILSYIQGRNILHVFHAYLLKMNIRAFSSQSSLTRKVGAMASGENSFPSVYTSNVIVHASPITRFN